MNTTADPSDPLGIRAGMKRFLVIDSLCLIASIILLLFHYVFLRPKIEHSESLLRITDSVAVACNVLCIISFLLLAVCGLLYRQGLKALKTQRGANTDYYNE